MRFCSNPGNIIRKHSSPYWPVVVGIRPNVQPVVNALSVQNLRHPLIVAPAKIMLSRTQYDLHVVEVIIVRIWHKIGRVVEKDILIVIAIQVPFDVKSATHAKEVSYFFRVLERKIERLVAAKTTTCHADFIHTAFILNPRDQFFIEHAVVANVVIDAHTRMQVFGIKTVVVNAVDTVKFDLSSVHEPLNRLDQLEIFVFEKTPH